MTDEQYDYLDLLNTGLIGIEVGFQPIRAQKDYIDLFGDEIKAREVYFARSLENHSLIKTRISERSMEKIIALLFTKSRAEIKLLEATNIDEEEAFKRHQAGVQSLQRLRRK